MQQQQPLPNPQQTAAAGLNKAAVTAAMVETSVQIWAAAETAMSAAGMSMSMTGTNSAAMPMYSTNSVNAPGEGMQGMLSATSHASQADFDKQCANNFLAGLQDDNFLFDCSPTPDQGGKHQRRTGRASASKNYGGNANGGNANGARAGVRNKTPQQFFGGGGHMGGGGREGGKGGSGHGSEGGTGEGGGCAGFGGG